MKRFLIFLAATIFSFSCNSDDPEETREYAYTVDSLIVPPDPNGVLRVATVASGENLVFKYEYRIPSDPEIADSGFTEILLFEIDRNLTFFVVSDAELSQINAFYRQVCFCATNDSFPVTGGTIQGRQRSTSSWEIDIDLIFDYGLSTKELQLSETFRQQR